MIVKWSLEGVERARLVLRGGSVFDWRRLNVTSFAEGDAVLRVNGFDPENQGDRARLREIRLSAIDYLERNFGFYFAPEIVHAESPCKLMLLASGGEPLLRRQACTVLKIMQIIHHVDARELKSRLNISDRALYHLVEEKTTHAISEMKAQGYPVIDFQSSRKTHDSIITKLLSKRQGIWDPHGLSHPFQRAKLLQKVESQGTMNFLEPDDVPLAPEGEPIDPDSIVPLPFRDDKPVFPEI